MLRFFNKRLHNRKGFTLIELIVVIAILAILALVAIPRFTGLTANAKWKADIATATTIGNAAEVYFIDKAPANGAAVTLAALHTAGYLREDLTAKNTQLKPTLTFSLTVTDDGKATVTYSGTGGAALFPTPTTTIPTT